jgi:hypothetical protein
MSGRSSEFDNRHTEPKHPAETCGMFYFRSRKKPNGQKHAIYENEAQNFRLVFFHLQVCYNLTMTTPLQNEQTTPPPQLTPEQLAEIREQERKQKQIMVGIIAVIVLLVALLGVAIYFLLQPETPTDKIRDVFIIVVALETLVIGVALIVLVVQLASLINLLQNEVRPILQATSETVNTLRGTAEFLGENVVEPVIKLNGYLAGLKRMLELLGIKPK